jgi:hypothetical protein
MTHAEFLKAVKALGHILNEKGLLQQIYKTSSLTPSEDFFVTQPLKIRSTRSYIASG